MAGAAAFEKVCAYSSVGFSEPRMGGSHRAACQLVVSRESTISSTSNSGRIVGNTEVEVSQTGVGS
jgi:hypothetical protein